MHWMRELVSGTLSVRPLAGIPLLPWWQRNLDPSRQFQDHFAADLLQVRASLSAAAAAAPEQSLWLNVETPLRHSY
jgi:hypothetical protein